MQYTKTIASRFVLLGRNNEYILLFRHFSRLRRKRYYGVRNRSRVYIYIYTAERMLIIY